MKIADIRRENSDIRYECDEILCDILNIDRTALLLRLFDDIGQENEEIVKCRLTRLRNGEPLQYILKRAPFFGRDFFVDEGVLIPRYDTECLITASLERLEDKKTFADACCGSGCIGITLLCELHHTHGVLLDISDAALSVSRANAKKHAVSDRCDIQKLDVTDKSAWDTLGKFDVIVSNPPYIPTCDIPNLSEQVLREPHIALDGGEDGMDFYKKIIEYSAGHFTSCVNIIFEIGYDEGEKICALAKDFGLSCEIRRDINGCDRVALLNER